MASPRITNPLRLLANELKATKTQKSYFESHQLEIVVTPFIGLIEGFSGAEITAAIPAFEAVQAGTALTAPRGRSKKGKKLSLTDYIAGLGELEKILAGKDEGKLISAIVARNYKATVLKILQAHKEKHSSLSRGGGGSVGGVEGDSIMLPDTLRNPDELGTKWRAILQQLVQPLRPIQSIPTADVGQTYGAFSLAKILQVQMDSSVSKYRNVFLLGEFGTGESASPRPRLYQSRGTTPYKVRPQVASYFGGATSWWFSSILARDIADKSANVVLQALKSARKKHRKLGQIKANPLSFAFGAGSKAMKPSEILFDARGMVSDLRAAYEEFYRRCIEDIDETLQEYVVFWPKGGIKPVPGKAVAFIRSFEALANELATAQGK